MVVVGDKDAGVVVAGLDVWDWDGARFHAARPAFPRGSRFHDHPLSLLLLLRGLVRELVQDPKLLGGRRVENARQGLSLIEVVSDKNCGVRVSGGVVGDLVETVAWHHEVPTW